MLMSSYLDTTKCNAASDWMPQNVLFLPASDDVFFLPVLAVGRTKL